MGNIYEYKTKSGRRYYYSLYLGRDSNGKRIIELKRGFVSKKQAKKAYDEAKRSHEYTKKLQTEKMSSQTLRDYYENEYFPEWSRTVRAQTAESVKYIVDKEWGDHFSRLMVMPIKSITKKNVQEWLRILEEPSYDKSDGKSQKRCYSPSYTNRCLGVLKAIFAKAKEDKFVEENPAQSIKSRKITRSNTKNDKVEFWEKEEFEKAMEYFDLSNSYDKFLYLAYYTLMSTGIRIGELGGLWWEDIDLDTKKISIKRNLLYKNKKEFETGELKTKSSKRTIIISSKLRDLLKEWQDIQKGIGEVRHVFFFDGTPFCEGTYRYHLDKAAEEMGVKKIKLHGLRHSFATHAIKNNIATPKLQKTLGHSSIRTTVDIYGHLCDSDSEEISWLF